MQQITYNPYHYKSMKNNTKILLYLPKTSNRSIFKKLMHVLEEDITTAIKESRELVPTEADIPVLIYYDTIGTELNRRISMDVSDYITRSEELEQVHISPDRLEIVLESYGSQIAFFDYIIVCQNTNEKDRAVNTIQTLASLYRIPCNTIQYSASTEEENNKDAHSLTI